MENIKKDFVDEVIKNLETNNTIWSKGFTPIKAFNYKTFKEYTGSNSLMLMILGSEFADPRWMTFSQAKELKLKVKTGSKSKKLFKVVERKKTITKEQYEEMVSKGIDNKFTYGKPIIEYDENNKPEYFLVFNSLVSFNVFNAEQIEGVEEFKLAPPIITNENLDSFIDEIILNSPVPIKETWNLESACYISSETTNKQGEYFYENIALPKKEIFDSTEQRFTTLIHELAHSTGAPNRLNRKIQSDFGTVDYAREELVVALTEIFICKEYGISGLQDSHEAYIKSWIKLLKENPNEIYTAASKAEKVQKWLSDNVLDKCYKKFSL